MKKKLMLIVALAAALMMVMAACGGGGDAGGGGGGEAAPPPAETEAAPAPEPADEPADEPAADTGGMKKVGCLVQHMTDEWAQGCYNKLVQEGPANGYEVILADSEWELTKESQNTDTFLSANLDMVLIQPADDVASIANIQQFVDNGVPVLAVGVKPQAEEGLCVGFVGWDTFDSGYKLAQDCADYIEANLGGAADIALLSYPLNDNCRQRLLGFQSGLSFRNIEANYVADQNFDGSREKAMTIMENILQTNPDVQVVWAAFDAGALGGRAALQGANSDAKVWSCGGYGQEIYDLFAADDQWFVADYVVAPQFYVDGIFEAMDRYFAGDTQIGDFYVDFPIATAKNYKQVWGEE
ncbi:MAG: sugar ABC transporter substrate-binding protein [Clostridiales bacterium]|nr:sugar ABC transporter substrate-binding protein [Clostridiales bacterium]